MVLGGFLVPLCPLLSDAPNEITFVVGVLVIPLALLAIASAVGAMFMVTRMFLCIVIFGDRWLIKPMIVGMLVLVVFILSMIAGCAVHLRYLYPAAW